eukprot:scaffold48628_cov54-Phaeocystis_antarctica.AAC.2
MHEPMPTIRPGQVSPCSTASCGSSLRLRVVLPLACELDCIIGAVLASGLSRVVPVSSARRSSLSQVWCQAGSNTRNTFADFRGSEKFLPTRGTFGPHCENDPTATKVRSPARVQRGVTLVLSARASRMVDRTPDGSSLSGP